MSLSVFTAAPGVADRPALVVDGVTVSYAELAAGARAAVAYLRERRLESATLVALHAANDLPTLEMLHALFALGVPVLPLDPRLTPAEQSRILAEAAPAAVIDGGWRAASHGAPPAEDPDPKPDDERTLAVVYTSGTAGRPKGVVLSRSAFVASARASEANLGWQPDDRWLLRLPVAHVGGLSVVTRCLLARRTVVVSDARDPEALLATIESERVTVASLVPTLLTRILALDPPRRPPPGLRAVLLGGGPASRALLERAADRRWPVLTTYGLTEACSQVTTQRYGTTNRGELGAGPPLPGFDVRIGDAGEIHVRGPSLHSAYFPPRAHPDPFTRDGWLRTGDHGRLDEQGNLHVEGRRADRIITGGENVDPVEVEQALESAPGVRQACVFGVPDAEWGEVVCVAVVVDERDVASVREMIRAATASLAGYKKPRRVAVVEEMPFTPSGKVDRAAVARLATPHLEPY